MSRLLFAPLIVVIATTLACVTTSADILRLDPKPRPPTDPSTIQMIGKEPSRPYAVIAIVSAHSSLTLGDVSPEVRQRLLKEAGRLGGHAVLLDASSLTRTGGENEHTQLTGKVIVYTDSTGSN